MNSALLTDRFGRVHDYLRISLTDACNLRCTYCMPENAVFSPFDSLLRATEILTLATAFVRHGVKKIRLTGGEPLVRPDVDIILRGIHALRTEGLQELTLTTNGLKLHDHVDTLESCGVRSLNISLDTLLPERFLSIAKRDHLHRVLSNIHLLLDRGFQVKVNMVVMRGINDDEVSDFIRWTRDYPLQVRFIEFMPFSGNRWADKRLMTTRELLERAAAHFDFEPLTREKNDTAQAYRVWGFSGTFAFISTMSEPFCSGCNRIRLTADGKIKNCLFSKDELDLRTALREGRPVEEILRQAMESKEKQWGGQQLFEPTVNRSMVSIGG